MSSIFEAEKMRWLIHRGRNVKCRIYCKTIFHSMPWRNKVQKGEMAYAIKKRN